MLGMRRRMGTALGALAVAALISACGGPGARMGAPTCPAHGGPPDPVTARIFERVNIDRGAAQLPPLAWNDQLYCLALDWSTQMGTSGSLRHRDLGAVLYSSAYDGYRTLGENILRGPASMTADQMEDAWMNSPDHRANILSGAYSSIGIGLYYTPGGQVYATQNFGG